MSLSRPANFPLLKLPWLCIRCVFQNWDLFDIIYFATISNRTRRIVKNSKYPLKEIEVHPRWERKIYMGKTIGAATDRKIWCFKNSYCGYGDKFVLQKNSQPLRTGSSYNPDKGYYLESYTADELDALKMGIDFLIDIFGCKIRKLYVHGDKLPELFRLGISSVKELSLSSLFNIADLKYLLETIEVTDKYLFYAQIPKEFSCDPRIFKCRQLFFGWENSADWVTLKLLCQLDVPQLFFMHHRFSIKDIVSYVTYWFNSENRKLESLLVDFQNPISQENFKIDHLSPMPFDEKRRKRCAFVGGWGNADLTRGMDILRKDGLLATVHVDFKSVFFYVWHNRFPDTVQK
ncbi:unnamed protein product [Caenorhabditis brenneri]